MTAVISFDTTDLRAVLVTLLSREWRIAAESIDCDRPLTEYGLDSITALTISGELEELLDIELPSTLLWDCPTVNAIASYLGENRRAAS
jgi:acyl carrier protein